MSEERTRILKMIAENKISVEEGEKLLEALAGGQQSPAAEPGRKEEAPSGKGRVLRVRVYEGDRDKPKVNINLPLKLVSALKGLIPEKKLAKLEEKGIDLSALDERMKDAGDGPIKLVDIEDDDDKVEIFIE